MDHRRDRKSYLITCIAMLVRAVRVKGPFQVVILSELGVQYSWVAKLIALRHRAPLIVDAFVGMYETNVEDWKRVSPASARGRIYRFFDWLASRLSNIALIDTEVRTLRLIQDGARTAISCPVGAPEWARPSLESQDTSKLRILYYGNYIPLHGLDFVVDNLARTTHLDMEIVFIGDGEGRPPIEERAVSAGLSIQFFANVPESDLITYIHNADIVLGVFGESEKAATVIANKVWQGLAAGRHVITRSSEALEEIRNIVGRQLIVVDVDNPFGLAEAIIEVEPASHSRFNNTHLKLEQYVDAKFDRLRRAIDKR